jgi:hypothetical protein
LGLENDWMGIWSLTAIWNDIIGQLPKLGLNW